MHAVVCCVYVSRFNFYYLLFKYFYFYLFFIFFFQAEDGIRDLVRSRGLGDVYKRQGLCVEYLEKRNWPSVYLGRITVDEFERHTRQHSRNCLLYTSDAADERSSVDLGGRRIIKKKTTHKIRSTIPIEKQETDKD